MLSRFAADHHLYVHQLNLLNDTALLVQLDDAALRDHSFLDQRVLSRDLSYDWVSWSDLEAAASSLPQKTPAYIFHVGHCGSTLLSRLVAASTDTQALREPLPLRTFSIDQAFGHGAILDVEQTRGRLALLERAWARGPSQTVVKATSVCTNLMGLVDPAAPLLFVFQQPEIHLAVILAGENALTDLRGFANYRYLRLAQDDVDLPPLAGLSVGELAALSLLAEAVAADRALGERSASKLDFDRFLEEPGDRLSEACRQLDLDCDPERCRSTLAGPIMRSYSKAPEHPYDPQLRSDIITESRARNGGEITAGMALIDRLAASNADVRSAVEMLSG